MSSSSSELGVSAGRGRRKQAKPQKKNVEAAEELVVTAVEVKREPGPESMSPDSNHNLHLGSVGQGGTLPEMEITMKLVKSEPDSTDDDASEGADPRIREYLGRTDTAIVFPEDPARIHDSDTVPLPGAGLNDRASPEENCYIKCSFCDQGLTSFQALKEHVDALHPGGAFPCVHCPATFPSRDQLEKHEQQLHSANQQVSCKVCNKTFANVYRLQRHMISHDESANLRKFKCPECDKAFKFKHHLKEHIRIHSGEKPFKCNNCGKRFSHSGSYSSHMTSKKCLNINPKMIQRKSRDLTPYEVRNRDLRALANQQPPTLLKQSPPNNNFPPLLPKYSEAAAAAFLSNFPPHNPSSGIHPYFFSSFTPSQNPSYGLPPSLNNLIDHFNKAAMTPPAQDVKITEVKENGSPKRENESPRGEMNIVIKKEVNDDIKEEEEVEHKPVFHEKSSLGACGNGGDFEEVKRILETVSAKVTNHFLQENMQKLSPMSSGSGCPSVGSGAATPPAEEQSESLSCCYCRKVFISGIALHQHERYLCNRDDEKSEGLAAKLEDVATKTETNGVSCSGSEDETRGSRELMTEDEDGDTVDQDGRKVRVRSQISEDQLIILKQNYTLNPRPKREELSRIADTVGLAVRVVQVWFQNNRARDRREGRFVHIPFVQQTPWYPSDSTHLGSEQPLDLSTKKSQGSSPVGSPPRSDSEEAVNLTQKPQLFIRPLFPQRSPSPMDSSKLARMLSQPLRFPTNGSAPMERMFYASPEQTASRSPIPGIALYNGNSSPSPGSEIWWKRNFMETQEADEFVHADDMAKRFNMAAEPNSDGQRPHKCDVCSKAFKHKHHLTEHKRLHSGEKPFQCGKCLKRFSHSGSYSQHMNHRYSYCKPYRE